jgi:hypothetical protein
VFAACATTRETSAIQPALGHYQPLPAASNDADPAADPGPDATADPDPDPDSDEPTPPSASEETVNESSISPTAEEDALCRHIVKIVQSESPDPATDEQTAELIVSCGFALAHDRRRIGAEEFERRSACMFLVSTVEEFAACTPEPAPSDPP